ncbi:uncharacterized protein hmgxb4b [Festucalex cinctus]
MKDCKESQLCVEDVNTSRPCKVLSAQELVVSVREFSIDNPNKEEYRPYPFMADPSSVMTTLSHAVARPTNDTVASSGSALDTMGSPKPACSDPICAAAHLHLLGEALSLIGHILKGTNKSVCVSRSLILLLDSLLCVLAPLMCLTSHIPELHSCTENILASTLENIAYMMPGF